MIYFWICLISILFLIWSYPFIKTYQLSGYNIPTFFDSVLSLNLSFGDKNKLKFTKRMLRFIGLFSIISIAIIFLVFFFDILILLILKIFPIFQENIVHLFHLVSFNISRLFAEKSFIFFGNWLLKKVNDEYSKW